MIQHFFKGISSLSSLLAESKPTCTRRFMLRGDEEKERDRRQSEEGETPHACLRIVYPLFISQNLKIIPHLIPPLAAAPPPCFIHVAINKEQKTVFCKVTHRMRTWGRQFFSIVPFHPQIKLHHQPDTIVRIKKKKKKKNEKFYQRDNCHYYFARI